MPRPPESSSKRQGKTEHHVELYLREDFEGLRTSYDQLLKNQNTYEELLKGSPVNSAELLRALRACQWDIQILSKMLQETT